MMPAKAPASSASWLFSQLPPWAVDDVCHGRDESLAIVSDDGEHERCHETTA